MKFIFLKHLRKSTLKLKLRTLNSVNLFKWKAFFHVLITPTIPLFFIFKKFSWISCRIFFFILFLNSITSLLKKKFYTKSRTLLCENFSISFFACLFKVAICFSSHEKNWKRELKSNMKFDKKETLIFINDSEVLLKFQISNEFHPFFSCLLCILFFEWKVFYFYQIYNMNVYLFFTYIFMMSCFDWENLSMFIFIYQKFKKNALRNFKELPLKQHL